MPFGVLNANGLLSVATALFCLAGISCAGFCCRFVAGLVETIARLGSSVESA